MLWQASRATARVAPTQARLRTPIRSLVGATLAVALAAVALAPEVHAYGDAPCNSFRNVMFIVSRPRVRPRLYAIGLEDTAGILPHS